VSDATKISPPVWLMALAAFTVGCSMRLLDPLLPMVGEDLGVSLGKAAQLIGGFAIGYALGQLAAGPIGDALGKMRVAAVALAFYAAALLGSMAAPDFATLFALRFAAGVFAAATIPLFMAHIGDSVPYAQRQATLGRFMTGMVMAQLLAGPIAGIVGEATGWRGAFLVLGLLATAITIGFALLIGPAWQGGGRGGGTLGLGGFVRLFGKRTTRRLMLATGVDGLLLMGGALPFIGSALITLHGMSPTEAGLIGAGFGIGSFAYTRSAAWLVRRLGERRMVLTGALGLCAAFMAIALAQHWAVVAVATAATGLLFFMLHGVLQARATEALPEARGTAVAGFAMSLFIGQSLGALLFGALIGLAGFPAAFAVAGVGVVLLAVAIRRWVLPASR
jgi:predicted MFS family arabinose efflux permease